MLLVTTTPPSHPRGHRASVTKRPPPPGTTLHTQPSDMLLKNTGGQRVPKGVPTSLTVWPACISRGIKASCSNLHRMTVHAVNREKLGKQVWKMLYTTNDCTHKFELHWEIFVIHPIVYTRAQPLGSQIAPAEGTLLYATQESYII